MKQKKEIRMEDIAKELNISIVSVSNALRNKKGVSTELRQRVKETADALGYQIPQALEEEEERICCIGIMIAERYIEEPSSFYMDIYKHIARLISEKNGLTFLAVISEDEEARKMKRSYYKDAAVDGIIFIGRINTDFIREVVEELEVPSVGIDFYDLDVQIDYIIPDHFRGTQHITQQLIDAGHRDIAFLGDPYSGENRMDQYMGYCKALWLNGLREYKDQIIPPEEEAGSEIVLPQPGKLPTAIIISDESYTESLLKALGNKGLKVPEDVSLAGAGCFCPVLPEGLVLTGYRKDEAVLAYSGVDILKERLEGRTGRGAIHTKECCHAEGNTVKRISESGTMTAG